MNKPTAQTRMRSDPSLPGKPLSAQARVPQRINSAALKILRPLARLFIGHGLTFGDAEKILKQAFFDAGNQELIRSGIEPNMSRLSVSSGLHRKDIRRFVDQRELDPDHADEPARSLASELYTRWVTDRRLYRGGDVIDLPLRSVSGSLSFEWLARQISTDAHARALLEDLKRLGLVTLTEDGSVRVNPDGFVPILARTEMLELLGDNLADHLDTAVANVLEDGEKRLEQSVFVAGLSAQAVNQIEAIARPLWVGVMNKVVAAMKRAGKRDPATADKQAYRVRTGMFFYTDLPRTPISHTNSAAKTLRKTAKTFRSER